MSSMPSQNFCQSYFILLKRRKNDIFYLSDTVNNVKKKWQVTSILFVYRLRDKVYVECVQRNEGGVRY